MTTEPKKALPIDAGRERAREMARERKKRFDARMRNANAGEGGERRHAVVVYLTNDAKEVLWRNRQRRRLLDLPPILDSVLINELLLSYGAQAADDQANSLLADVTTAQTDSSKLLKANERQLKRIKALELHNFVAEETIALLKEQEDLAMEYRPFDWSVAEDNLLEAHRYLMTHAGYWLAIRLRERLSSSSGDSHAAKIFNEEITDYIEQIIDVVS